MQPAVYVLANRRYGTLYIGVTSNLLQRIWLHRDDMLPGFTRNYGVHRLVYFELHASMPEAIAREKQLKEWRRSWKLQLIDSTNSEWRDLWDDIVG